MADRELQREFDKLMRRQVVVAGPGAMPLPEIKTQAVIHGWTRQRQVLKEFKELPLTKRLQQFNTLHDMEHRIQALETATRLLSQSWEGARPIEGVRQR